MTDRRNERDAAERKRTEDERRREERDRRSDELKESGGATTRARRKRGRVGEGVRHDPALSYVRMEGTMIVHKKAKRGVGWT